MTPSGSAPVVWGALALRPGGSGVQTYQREFMRAAALAGSGHAFAAVVQRDAVGELPASVHPLTRPIASGVRRALSGLRPVRTEGIFHSLDVDLPVAQRRARVSTVHDMSVFDAPWASGPIRARGERALLRRSLNCADAVIAVSAFTAERVQALTGRMSTVIPLAPASWARVPARAEVRAVVDHYGLPDRFVLQLGTLEPRKCPEVAAEAARVLGLPMVLAGAGTEAPNLAPGTMGLGYVDRAHVPALYRAATVVAYASRYEGFGLPPLEAMACGGVVAASAVGGIPEAVGAGAVVVRANTVESWVDALKELAFDGDRRTELLHRAERVVRNRSWDAVAAETLAVYRTVS
ncbi:glycosyltransferase family 4 protein [Dietzia sp. WMMA184]|uniref:glycosyltransferase family 4 protein n=1 Tax=unclassified Dietzia TaxID=2617939 RepID=UPI000BDE6FEF